MKRLSSTAALSFAAALALHVLPARAQDVPSWFVPEDKCAARKCTCDDVPMMDAFLANQKAGRDAWMSVKTDILTATGPASPGAAIKLFQSRFPGDPRVVAQFKTCSGYDASKNNPSKVAGVSTFGSAALDPCFCNAFCKDIVDSTIAHEKMHVPTIIAGVVSTGDTMVACKFGIVSGRICDALAPLALANSEIISHDAGISSLQAARDKLLTELVDCSPMPLEDPPPQQAKATPAPAGFFARVTLLLRRIFRGAVAEETFAALDAVTR